MSPHNQTAPDQHQNATGEAVSTLVELARAQAAQRGSQRLYTFETPNSTSAMSYGALDLRARQIAGQLGRRAQRGDRALLLYAPGLDYIAGFFGCLYAGVIPVPAYPPGSDRSNRSLSRVVAIMDDASPACLLTTRELAPFLAESFKHTDRSLPPVLMTDTMTELQPGFELIEPAADDIAFLQYTSGSTGAPKGVMLSHRNLIENLRAIQAAFELNATSKGVVWLPPYHDMGLIGGILEPLYVGFEVVLLSPADFAARPLRWLDAISRHRATISGGPSSAFEMCVRRARSADLSKLDLSSWRVAFVGAEPISADAIADFCELFSQSGFERDAVLPCYGLAEATLLVTSGKRGQGIRRLDLATDQLANRRARQAATPTAALPYVSCGRPQPKISLQIVDPESRESLPANSIGEVWISGPSVAHGYFQDSAQTEAAFERPATKSQTTDAPARWLRTGDLGTLLDDGELLITGRLKDLVIVHGVNHHPQDIERTVALSTKAVRSGRVIVFSIPVHGREQVACVAEVGRASLSDTELSAIARTLRAAVSQEHGVGVHTIALVAPSMVPRTSSGKLQRRECRAGLLEGKLPSLYTDSLSSRSEGVGRAPQTAHEQRVAALFSEILGATAVGVDDDFFDLGGTSLSAAQVAARIADESRVELALQAIFVGRTVSAIAQWLDASAEAASDGSAAAGREILTRMCAIAAEVLGVAEVSPTADFFAMGGTSLSAMLIFARVDQEFNVELPLEAMLELKDMQHLAQKIERSLHAAQEAAPDEAAEQAPIPKLAARPRPAQVPLSYAQQRLWLLDSFRSATLAYTIPIGLRLRGSLNVASLEHTFASIVERHEALRTTFRLEEGQPVQIVHVAPETWPMRTSEHLNLSGAARDAVCEQVGRDDVLTPFDLLRGPLLRTQLVRFAPDDHFLLVSMHHIVSDGWSISVLLREFIGYYSAFTQHGSAAGVQLPALVIQYPDFALWEREVFTERRLRASLMFFRTQLEDVPSVRLPTTFARLEQLSGRGKVYRFTLPTALASAAKQLSERESATLFMATLTAFRCLLSVLCDQLDFAVGVPVANRSRPQLEPLIGFFVNTLALRVRLDDDPSFSEMLARERRSALLSFGHQEVPFDKVIESLGKTRDMRSDPLVSTMFVLQNVPLGELALPGLDATPHWGIGETSKFELTLSLVDWKDETLGMVEYSSDLFDDAAIRKFTEMYQRVLALACVEPTTRLSDFRAVVFQDETDHEAFIVRCLAQRANLGSDHQVAPEVTDATPPSNDTERIVQELCADVLEGRRLGVYSDFLRSGGNSLRAVLLLARVQQHFDIEVPVEAFFAEPHIAGLSRLIDAQRVSTSEPRTEATLDGGHCVAFSQDVPNGQPAPIRIFLVHEIHGDIFCYRTLAAELGPSAIVYGVPAPSTPISTIPALAERTLAAIRKVQEQGPYIIGGFSFGGVVAHEMARQLEQLGEHVSALLLLDSHAEILGRTPDDATRAAIRREVDELAATLPPSQRMKRVEGALARLASLEQHAPGSVAAPSLLVRAAKFDGPRDLGWTSLLSADLNQVAISAHHGTLLKPPFVSEVALIIRDHLAKTTKHSPLGR